MKRSNIKKNSFLNSIDDSIKLKKKLGYLQSHIDLATKKIYRTIKNKKKILICGNGGSAADAQHLAAEFLVRLNPNVNRKPYPVINLAQDISTLTACGNDLGFDEIFSRNLEAFGNIGDLLISISTSGNSNNIIKVLKKAKILKINSISLLGNKGGKAQKYANLNIIVPSSNTARIQECHMFLGHFIFNEVEKMLIKNK